MAGRRAVLARGRRRLLVALAAVAVSAPVGLAVAKWPRWWAWIAPENTPMTWLQSSVLVLCSAAAGLVSLLLHLRGTDVRGRRPWLLLAAGFAALAIDERFALHERFRDRVLAPRDISVPFLPWIAPGDFLLLMVALAGLAVLPSVWRAVSADPASRQALVLGVALAVGAVGLDSIDPSTWSIDAERIQQTGEEVLEMASGLCFLAAVALRLLGLLEEPAPPADLHELSRPADGTTASARGERSVRRRLAGQRRV